MSKNPKKKQGKQKVAYYKKDNSEYNRPISDNSQKYEIFSDSENEAPDFNYLLKQPTAPGSHFVFKCDQEKFEGDNQTTQFSKYFNVDIKLLNCAIKSIPFNERHENGIKWTSEELERMREEAEISEKAYKELLEVKSHKSEEKIEKVTNLTNKVEELNIEPPKKKDPVEPPKSDDKKSMEKWLDNILDI